MFAFLRKFKSGKPTVLAIDDGRTDRLVFERALERLGVEVITAGSGPEGLRLAESELPDVIILDIVMPGMDGYEVLAFLKENPKTADVPAIVCSARQKGKEIDRAFALGAAAYLIKPFTLDQLLNKVGRFLSGKNGR